jgi:hypothetical protein
MRCSDVTDDVPRMDTGLHEAAEKRLWLRVVADVVRTTSLGPFEVR